MAACSFLLDCFTGILAEELRLDNVGFDGEGIGEVGEGGMVEAGVEDEDEDERRDNAFIHAFEIGTVLDETRVRVKIDRIGEPS